MCDYEDIEIISKSHNTYIMKCVKCNQETGAEWKDLCRECWNKRTLEEIRAYRQAKLDRKIARLRKGADSRDNQAATKQSEWIENSKDWAYVTQPNINTSRGRAFTRQREKVLARYDAGIKLSIEADELRKKAEWLEKQGAVVKGDAERERQQKREELDKIISVGSKVYDFAYREGVVKKVNKKTYTVKFTSGFTCTRDKTFVKPIQ